MQLSNAERDNIVKWQGQNGFYEVYYLKFNHRSTRTAFWLRYTLLAPVEGGAVAELWAVFFDALNPKNNSAVKETFPISSAEFSREKFYFRIDNAELTHNSARGEIKKSCGSIRWDLNYEPQKNSFYHYPHPVMYKMRIPKTKVCSPNFDIKINGRIEINGREIICDKSPGQQSHIWGTKHAESWVWANCNAFSNRQGIFEGLSAQIRAGKFLSPPLTTLYVMFKNSEYYMNGLWRTYKNFSLVEFPVWKFHGVSGECSFEGEAWSGIENFVGVEYTDPDGDKLWCYNSKVANMKIIIYKGAHKIDELISDGTTALEFVSRIKHDRIPVLI